MRAHAGDADFARRDERVHGRDRRRVVDHAFESVGQADQLAEPAERDRLELGGGRRRAPQHRLLVERGRQKFGEDAGRARRDGEVREEARMVPVGEAGHEHALEVGHDGVERLRLLRRRGRKRRA